MGKIINSQINSNPISVLLSALEETADIVALTLGPYGRNVMIYDAIPHNTKDGVTVLKNIYYKDKFKDMAVRYLRNAAMKVCEMAGDGTTTCTVLSSSIYKNAVKVISENRNIYQVKAGMEYFEKEFVKILSNISKKVESFDDIRNIAKISSNSDQEIVDTITECYKVAGNNSSIICKEGGYKTEIIINNGYEFENGLLSDIFSTSQVESKAEYENPLIFLYNGILHDPFQVLNILRGMFKLLNIQEDKVIPSALPPLVIIAEDISGDALISLAMSKAQKGFKFLPIKAPGFGYFVKENLIDLQCYVGCNIYEPSSKLEIESDPIKYFGSCERIVVNRTTTTIVGGRIDIDSYNARINKLNNDKLKSMDPLEIDMLNKRLSKLSGTVVVVNVGATSQAEMKEKLDRYDDTISAVKSAIEEGIVAGGGTTLYYISKLINPPEGMSEDFCLGIEICKNACLYPITKILSNGNVNFNDIKDEIDSLGYGYGYNLFNNKIENMFEAGVIDPAKVVRCVVESSISIAKLLIITDALIVNEVIDEK